MEDRKATKAEQAEIKLCITCKHYYPDFDRSTGFSTILDHRCSRRVEYKISLVDGRPEMIGKMKVCSAEREKDSTMRCGVSGVNWEAKHND